MSQARSAEKVVQEILGQCRPIGSEVGDADVVVPVAE